MAYHQFGCGIEHWLLLRAAAPAPLSVDVKSESAIMIHVVGPLQSSQILLQPFALNGVAPIANIPLPPAAQPPHRILAAIAGPVQPPRPIRALGLRERFLRFGDRPAPL